MPQLMECPPVGALTEQLGGATVRQSGSTGDWTAVDAWYRSRRLTIRQEHRAGRAPSQQSREQKGGARLPEHPLHCTAFTRDAGTLVRQVQIVDVERQDLVGACRGLV